MVCGAGFLFQIRLAERVLFVVLAVVLDGGGSAAVGRHILLKAGEFLLGRPPADQDQAGVVAPGFPGGTAGAAFGLAGSRALGGGSAPGLAAAPLSGGAAGGRPGSVLRAGGLFGLGLVFATAAAGLFALGLRGPAVAAGPLLGGLAALGRAARLAVLGGGPLFLGGGRHRLGRQDGGLGAGQEVGVELGLLGLCPLGGTGFAIPTAAPGAAALLSAF